MRSPKALYQWTGEVARQMPHLSKAEATVLAMWSFGMVLAHSCGLSAVTGVMAALLGKKENSVRQRLREFCYDAEDKQGKKRRQIDMESCFVPLLKWVMGKWKSNQLALAMDATTLGERFIVLAISVVYRGCAVPVIWTILPAREKHPWRKEWLRMFRTIKPAIPKSMIVIVLADRDLYAGWLYKRIADLRWHPFLRINNRGTFRPEGKHGCNPFTSFVPKVGTAWSGRGTAFAGSKNRRQLNCTLLACWEEGYKDPWLVLTDLAPESAHASWYGLRSWIEQGFKITKRAGWQWQNTRMKDPERASRLWLTIAVATLWLLSVGSEADLSITQSAFGDLSSFISSSKKTRKKTRLRLVSIFRRGLTLILIALINHSQLPLGSLVPEPWPNLNPSLSQPLETFSYAA